MSSTEKKPGSFLESTDTTSLPSLEPLSFPSFPSLVELAEETPVKMEKGMFETFLNDPAQIYQDALSDPAKYEAGVLELSSSLLQGRKLKELTPEEMRLLDRATLSFVQVPRTAPAPTKPRPQPKPVVVEEKPTPGVDVPMTELPAFWWV